MSLGRIAVRLRVAKSSVSVWTRDVTPAGTVPSSIEVTGPRRLPVWRSGRARRCSRCRLVLPLESFNRMGDKRQWYCRECFRAYFRARGAKHREQSGAAHVERRRRARQHVLELLGLRPCSECGEADPVVLEFDHVGGKRDAVGNLIAGGAGVDRLVAEIARCDVVCVNCHRRRTAERAGWLRSRPDWRTAIASRPPVIARNVAFVYEHLERHGCVDCGTTDLVVLEFDHEGPKRWNVMAAAWSGLGVAALRLEMQQCAVRCGNCHRRVTARRGGHYWALAARDESF